jgi:hypothetical protein
MLDHGGIQHHDSQDRVLIASQAGDMAGCRAAAPADGIDFGATRRAADANGG